MKTSYFNRVNSSNETIIRTTVLQCADGINGSSRIGHEQESGFGGPELSALRNGRYKVKWLQYSWRRKILGKRKRTAPDWAPAPATLQPSPCWAMDHWSGSGPCPWTAGLISWLDLRLGPSPWTCPPGLCLTQVTVTMDYGSPSARLPAVAVEQALSARPCPATYLPWESMPWEDIV